MSKQYPGGLITKSPVTPSGPYETSTAAGIWTLNQVAYWTKQGLWPTPGNIAPDAYFNYVTMLLHGNGSASGTTNVLPFNSDASTNAFNLAINGDARSNNFNPYQAGYYSNSFDGSGDYLSVADANALDFAGDFTVEAWVFVPTTSGSARTIIHKADTNVGYALVLISAGNVEVQCTSLQFNSTSTLPLNQWNHVAMVRNGSGTNNVKFYLNGVLDGQGTNTTDTASSVTLGIGAVARSGAAGVNPLNGYISNVRTVSSAVYTSNFTPSTTPLTAISGTSLLTCQSNRFIDNSTNAFTITRNGDTTVSPAQPFTLPTSVATYGSGYFDGTTDYLAAPAATIVNFGTGDFTVDSWFYATTTSGNRKILDNYNGNNNPNPALILNIDGAGKVSWYSGQTSLIASSSTFVTNAWNYVTVSRVSGTTRMFLNGTQVGSASDSNNYAAGNASVGVGGEPYTSGGAAFLGYLTDVRVVKGSGVTSSTPPTSPLTAITNTQLLTTQYNGAGNNNGFKDSSQNNFVVTRNGNTTQGTFTPYGANWSNYFNGSSGVTVSSTSSQFGFSGDFTWEAWVNLASLPSSGGNYSIICSRGTVASNSAFQFLIGNSSGTYQITGTISISSSDSNLVWNISSAPSVGTWYHVAIVRSGSSVQAYWNGTAIGSAQTASGTTNTPTVNPSIGFRGGAYNDLFFSGYISNFRMVGSAVYTSNFTPSTTPLTAISGTRILTCADNRFVDDSTNAFTLTAYSSPSVQRFSPFSPSSAYSTNTVGGSGYFDGTGDYLGVANNVNATGNFTYEFWMYATGFGSGGYGTMVGASSGSVSNIFQLQTWSGAPNRILGYVGAAAGAGNLSPTFSQPVLNRWIHIAVVRSGSTVTMYENGVSVATLTMSNTINFGSTMQVGADGSANYSFQGYLTDSRLVIGTAVYTSTFTPPTAPLTAISGTTVLLSATNAAIYDNSMMNDLETVGNAMVSTSVKKYGTGSLAFDGTGDWLSVPDSQNFNFGSGNFTIEFWIYLNSVSGTIGILGKRTNEANYAPFIMIVTSSALKVYMSINGSLWAVNGLSTSTLSTSTWYNIAVTRSGSTVYMFLNGTSVGSTGTLSGALMTNTSPLYIGADSGSPSGSSTLNGYIDDLRVTKGYARYTANFTPPTSQFQDR